MKAAASRRLFPMRNLSAGSSKCCRPPSRRRLTSNSGGKKRGPATLPAPIVLPRQLASTLRAIADHERLVRVLRDLPPQIFVVAEGIDRRQHLLVVRVLGRFFRVDLVGGFEAGLHDRLTERAQLHAVRDQAFQCLRVAGVVAALLFDVAVAGGGFQKRLVVLRQLVPLGEIDKEVVRGAALPPARIVIKLRDLVETELLVVVGADPLGGIDRALLKRRIDVAAGELLRHHAKFGERLAGPAADPHFQSIEVLDSVDLLAEPAAHLSAGIAHQQALGIERGAEIVDQFLAFAVIVPSVLLAGVQVERGSAKQGPGRVLADIIILSAVTHLDGAVLHGVEHLQARYDLAGGEGLDLEFAVGGLGNIFRKADTGAEQGIERLRPARGQPPPQLRIGLRDGRRSNRGAGDADTGSLQELTTFHSLLPLVLAWRNRSRRRVASLSGIDVYRGVRRARKAQTTRSMAASRCG